MRHLTRAAVAIALATATALGGYAVSDATNADATTVPGPGLVTVTVGIQYSEFSLSAVKVRAGSTVQFLVRNDDPIAHEFVVGGQGVHERHRTGTHSAHPPVPGEVSVGPGEIGATFYRFDKPGKYLFACHLPGHVAFGMVGWIDVVPA